VGCFPVLVIQNAAAMKGHVTVTCYFTREESLPKVSPPPWVRPQDFHFNGFWGIISILLPSELPTSADSSQPPIWRAETLDTEDLTKFWSLIAQNVKQSSTLRGKTKNTQTGGVDQVIRVPALQVLSPQCKLQFHQKKKRQNKSTIFWDPISETTNHKMG
jgi:hypothetical protein